MEDLKEYFEGSLKDSITGELFHGSPKQIDVVLPNTASHGRPYVYASPDYLFALCYAGLQWNDFEINQSYYNGDLYLTEIQKGKFREKLQRPGYVYHLNKDDFKKLPNSGENEYISDQAVVPLSVDEIPNVYRRLDREGVHLIEYPNLPPFIEDREDYIIEQAKKLYVQDNSDMLEYLCSTFPGKVANSLKEYVSSYTGESTEDSSKDTYTDKDSKTILEETSDSDSADIPSENEENSEVSIEKEIPKVYFTREITPESLIRLYYKIAEGKTLPGKMMVKLSSGEPGGHNFLQPSLIGPLVNIVHGTICDANTAYEGPRKHTDTHYQTMKDHGFADIAPVDVLDGEGEIEIPVNDGYYLKTLPVGSHNSNYGSFLILTHFKGHAMAGFGGAIKNIAIGMASSRGKAIVHSGGQSETEIMGFDQQVFLKSMVDSIKASIDYGGRENFLYINVANRLSVDCDCDAHPAEPTMKDIGVFASTDPLAIDQACIDAVDRASDNKDLIARIKRQTGRNILKYAEDAGIGSRKYELIDLDAEPVSEDTFDQVLGSMFKEYSYPPHREEPMDTIPEQTVPSEHSFLRDEEDEKKPAPGFSSSIKKEVVTEGVIFDGKDIVLNLDSWKPEPGHNILFITGLSGSGKSTLAEKYEKEYHAHMFELDGLEHRYDSSGSAKILDKVREACPAYDEYFNDSSKSAKDNINAIWDAADKVLSIMKKDSKTLYIVEGVQLFDGLYSDDQLKGKPLIIKNTSSLKSIIRAVNRTAKYDEKSIVKAVKENLGEILANHRRTYKPFKKFKGRMVKETASDLDDLFNDALASFTESESKSESPLEQINLDNLRDLGSMFTELTTTSKLDENHKQKEKKNLSQFKKVVCTEDDIAKWKKKFPVFRHVRESDNCHFAFWMDNDEDLVAYVNIEPRDGDHVIQALEVSEKYKGSGLGSQLLKYAEDQGANKLFVNPENEVAVAMYKKGGWEYGPKSDGKLQPMIKEAAGVMEFLPYVGVKKDPPPDTDYPGSPFKALEESYETIFEFRNEMANECVKVMETPFSPNSVFIEAGDYHYPDIIHELVEDVITDIQNGSEDYADKSNLVWHITGENAEPLCAIADDLGFVQIPNIDPKNMDMVTYAMDIQEFTPEKIQYQTEAVDVTSIFRADDDYVYLNVPYCEFYIPTEYFTIGKKFAEDFTDKIHTIGLFNIGIFENDKLVDVKVFNVPVYLDIMVYDYDVRMIDVGSGTPVECRVYKYYQDSIICRSFIAENSGVAQTFLQLIISGSMPGTIPYNQILSVWRKNLELSSVHLGVSSAIMEMILAVVYRDSKDPSKKYCIRYGSSADSSEFDYMSASIRQICQYNSTFTGIIYEDIDSMITSAINRNRNGKEEGETPIERIIKM